MLALIQEEKGYSKCIGEKVGEAAWREGRGDRRDEIAFVCWSARRQLWDKAV